MGAELMIHPADDGIARVGARPLLEVRGLRVTARTHRDDVSLLNGVDLVVPVGTRVGVVGESGSGKSMTASAILGLLPPGVHVSGGSIEFDGRDLLALEERELRTMRGREISIVYQNAVASLNPLLAVGEQIPTVCRAHTTLSKPAAWARTVALLDS